MYNVGDVVVLAAANARRRQLARLVSFVQKNGEWFCEAQIFWTKDATNRELESQCEPRIGVNEAIQCSGMIDDIPVSSLVRKATLEYGRRATSTNERVDWDISFYCWQKVEYVSTVSNCDLIVI